MNKIKLLYIWVEKYARFEDLEVNFSTKYNFHYDKENNRVIYEENYEYIDNFFGENLDVTAVVGENGVGKTTLLQLIPELVSIIDGVENYNRELRNFIVIISEGDDNRRLIYRFDEDKHDLKSDDLYMPIRLPSFERNGGIRRGGKEFKNIRKCIYVTNVLDTYQYSNYQREYEYSLSDISTTGLIISDFKKRSKLNPIISFHYEELIRQCKFIVNYRKLNNYQSIIPFQLPKNLDVQISDLSVLKEEITKKLDDIILNENVKENIIKLITDKKTKDPLYHSLKDWIASSLLVCYLHDCIFIPVGSGYSNKMKLLGERLEDTFSKVLLSNTWDTVKKVFQCFLNKDENDESKELFGFMKWCDHELEKENSLLFNAFKYNYIHGVPFNLSLESTEEYLEFFEKYFKISKVISILDFSWGLSSGEMAWLSLFARFFSLSKEGYRGDKSFSLIDNSRRVVENAMILIDEADMMFHPAWQQKYVKVITKFLSSIYQGTYLQIVFATHSPIMLSDIPKQNVIYLRKKKENTKVVDRNCCHTETFGANIFRLFNNAFFLDEGAIGDFAEEKIATLLKMIDKNAYEESEEIERLINIIGDEYLKGEIKKRYLQSLDNAHHPSRLIILEKKIKMIQQEIDSLKKENRRNDEN